MNKGQLLFLTLFSSICWSYGQTQFEDVLIHENEIWALTSKGSVNIFGTSDGKKIEKELGLKTTVIALAKDKNGKIVIVDGNNIIRRYEGGDWKDIGQSGSTVSGLVFDNNNRGFTIGESGVTDIRNGQIYFSNETLNSQIQYKNSWSKKSRFMIDKRDNIWIGFGYGEWGGNMFIFNTDQRQFIKPNIDSFKMELLPIKSFFEDSINVYLSAGLQHMTTSGAIIQFENFKAKILFKSESHWGSPDKKGAQYMESGQYIGPGGFNPFNHCIYFYSQFGIYKGEPKKDLSKIENWDLILKPRLKWTSGQPDAVGSPMNVSKLVFIDKDRFIFVSQNDGIGFFDGNALKMIEPDSDRR